MPRAACSQCCTYTSSRWHFSGPFPLALAGLDLCVVVAAPGLGGSDLCVVTQSLRRRLAPAPPSGSQCPGARLGAAFQIRLWACVDIIDLCGWLVGWVTRRE